MLLLSQLSFFIAIILVMMVQNQLVKLSYQIPLSKLLKLNVMRLIILV
uniref:Uncharacterized protein n=1 Tax=Arcella intermedia TaxID=1963864 RepID=A0A6B2LQ41_9EUKA